MRRLFISTLPLFVAITALVLASPAARAQQAPAPGAEAAAAHACACCGNSSGAAMNHATAGAAAAEDHSAHQAAQAAAKPMEHGAGMACCGGEAKTGGVAAKAEAKPMEHAAAGGCCADMKMEHGPAAKAEAKPMEHAAAGGCCADMKMEHGPAAKAEAAPADHAAAGGCCAGMNHGAAAADAKPMAMGDPARMSDMQVFHFLLENRADVRRTVTLLPNGIDTLTESDKPEIATKIKAHVSAMYARLKDGRPIHQRDPLFVELFEHADQIDANITYTDKGLRVIETSTDPAVATLLHKHAATVDGFIKNGMPEMMKNHLE